MPSATKPGTCAFQARLSLLLGILVAYPLPAQFAKQIKTDIDTLSSEPALAVWQASHRDEKLQLAHYDTTNDGYEVDFRRTNRWCAASVSNGRAALFYVPEPGSGALPQTRNCRMEAIWYETQDTALVAELSAIWGQPNGQITEPDIRGSATWKGAPAWHRQGMNIWAVSQGQRMIVYARRDIPRDLDMAFALLSSTLKAQLIDAAAQIAPKDSELLEGAHCETRQPKRESDLIAIRRLAQWIKAATSLAPEQKASALILADAWVACSRISPDSLMQLGAEYKIQCPQDGPTYSHNLRNQAAGELAGIASLTEPCTLEGKGNWPDLVIAEGERLLNRYPKGQWTAWVHYAIARAHAARLSFAYPEGRPGGYGTPLTPDVMRKERAAAVDQFERFLKEKPDSPESRYAWQESWRLQAGLPPSPLGFDCGCE
jgi:hypothetical protein